MAEQTDREALEQLLARFGLKPYTGQAIDGADGVADSLSQPLVEPQADGEVLLVAKVGGVGGYSDFYASFTFDADGKFVSLDIGE